MRRRIIIFSGFLNSGKTSMLNRVIETFESEHKIIIFQCEEGMVNLSENDAKLIKYETFRQFRTNFIQDLVTNDGFDTIIMEYNGTWSLSEIYRLNLPNNFVIEHIAYFMDTETSLIYLDNMSNLILEQMNYSDTICLTNGNENTLDKKVLKVIRSLKKDTKILSSEDPKTIDIYSKMIIGTHRLSNIALFAALLIVIIAILIVTR